MNWGFIGYGRIAKKFYEDLVRDNHPIKAMASRSGAHTVPAGITAYSRYEDLLADSDIDIVYISTTHNDHAEWTVKSLAAGKHVLCEKPLSTSFKSSYEMVEAARGSGKFLMEAVWSRYLPGYQKAMELVREELIGEVLQVTAHFGFKMNPDEPKERLINPSLAAGAVWDVGIYPISLAQDVYKAEPMTIKADAILTDLRVENRCAIQMTYPNRGMAQLTCAVDLSTINTATITGENGHIIMRDFWKCEHVELSLHDGTHEVYELPMTGHGYGHEARACVNLINTGQVESPLMSWDDSLQLARIMDSVLEQIR